MKIKPSGFTLIELLVVIAIIGILSSVVLASLNTARNKGNDAAVKSNLTNARAQAELFASVNSDQYVITPTGTTDVCSATASVNNTKGVYQFVSAAARASGAGIETRIDTGGTTGTVATCHACPASGAGLCVPTYANKWAIEAPLKGSYPPYTNPMYCVDSSGKATTTDGSSLGGSDAACN
ncbi:MAG: putative Type pilus pilin [Parcubacteria group bacterium]|nr:putative Type pilus pilin [Parcubacteria group bacterium]